MAAADLLCDTATSELAVSQARAMVGEELGVVLIVFRGVPPDDVVIQLLASGARDLDELRLVLGCALAQASTERPKTFERRKAN